MKKRIKYFSYDKIPYLYEAFESDVIPFESLLDPDLKIAG